MAHLLLLLLPFDKVVCLLLLLLLLLRLSQVRRLTRWPACCPWTSSQVGVQRWKSLRAKVTHTASSELGLHSKAASQGQACLSLSQYFWESTCGYTMLIIESQKHASHQL